MEAKRTIKHSGKIFRDPIHGLIRIDPQDAFILDLIDTPEFQRLRRIRQLGVSCLTYHGAEHSRFVHSLGVFNFAQRIVEVLRRRYRGDPVDKYLEQHERVIKAAALLHDIVHGPFSHVIERAFESKTSHETRTVRLVRDDSSAVHQILRDQASVDPGEVASLIDHTSPHMLLTDIISSQLDADRMDYLLRDSYCTGVRYCQYDADWVMNALCIGRSPDGGASGDTESSQWRLCLDCRRAKGAVEQFLLARAHMNEQVYFHRVTRGYEVLLLNLFKQAACASDDETLPSGTPGVVAKFVSRQRDDFTTDDWLKFDEAACYTAFQSWTSGHEHADLAEFAIAFLNRKRMYFAVPLPSGRLLLNLQTKLSDQSLRQGVDWEIDDPTSSVYKGLHYAVQKSRDSEQIQNESILLASGDPDEQGKPIEATSDLCRYLESQKSKSERLYFKRALRPRFKPVFDDLCIKPYASPEEVVPCKS